MAFELPPLPWAEDALEPVTSARTISFHYGKHHKAYVDNLNKLVAGTDLENRSLEEVIGAAAGDAAKAGVFNNAAQVWNHSFFWQCMKPGGGGAPERRAGRQDRRHLRRPAGLRRAVQGGGRGPLRQRLGLAGRRRRHAQDRRARPTPRCRRRRSSRCSPATSGSTPTTSTSRTAGPTSCRPSGTAWSTGTSPRRTSPPDTVRPPRPAAGLPAAGAPRRLAPHRRFQTSVAAAQPGKVSR